MHANTEVFKKHESISSITLKDLSESEARKVLALFKDVKHLAMHNIVIYEDIRGFPQDLSELRLIDCKVEKELMMKWLSPLKSTLLRLGLDCFKHSFVLPKPKSPWLGHTTRHTTVHILPILINSALCQLMAIYSNSRFGECIWNSTVEMEKCLERTGSLCYSELIGNIKALIIITVTLTWNTSG